MTQPSQTGTLYLIPVPLAEGAVDASLPAHTLAIACLLNTFVVEHPKTARAWLKAMGHPGPMQAVTMLELSEHTPDKDLDRLLAPLLAGQDMGLMSEAGCPGVADPGAALVALAHQHGVAVIPLVGPSSLLLALMGSGLNGQQFAFNGYLPVAGEERRKAIKHLEQLAQKGQTQLFIETPYRGASLFKTLLETLAPRTHLTLAIDLTGPEQMLKTQLVSAWKRQPAPNLDKRPAVFLIGA
jgi:16S rRNA (cytidine1402-2'-O)-methyltransferase